MTTVARNSSTAELETSSFRSAARLALVFALAKLLIQFGGNLWQAHIGWGYFRDEFYYIACGRHLAWGYVDHGPLVALQARIAETIFGHSLAGLRTPAALAGASRVALTGLLAFALGGRRAAQGLAMLGVLVAPQYLALDSFLSMNCFESLFWVSCLVLLVMLQNRLAEEPDASASSVWLLFGLSAGLGLLNKPSMTFFLVSVGLALLCTRNGRSLLLRREALPGVALLIAISLPHLLWQVHHGWPTLEFLRNGRAGGKSLILGPLDFLKAQILTLNPVCLFLWVPGLLWLLRSLKWRWLGLTYAIFLPLMFVLHAKDYYVTPIYPLLFAAGGLAWEGRSWRPFGRLSAAPAAARNDRLLAFPLFQATLLLSGAILLPLAIPVMPPQTWLRYVSATHLYSKISNAESSPTGPLPQFYADRFGWQEEVNTITHVLDSLSPEDRARVTVRCDDYGEAGALQFLAPALGVPVVSGQNNYWFWGPGPRRGDLLLDITHDSLPHLHRFYREVTVVGTMDSSSWQMPFERRKQILLLRDPVSPSQTLETLWPEEKDFF